MSSNPIPMRFEQKANSSTNNILINANSPSSSNNNRSTSDFFSLRKRSDPNYSSATNVLDSTISLTGNLTSTSPPTIVTTPSISSSSSSSHTTSSSFLKSRRSSSVFEQVGGILDRFGRRLHSRSEIRDSTSSSRRPSSSFFNSTTNNGGSGSGGGSGSSVGIGSGGDLSIIPPIKSTDLGEAVSLEEYSPSENPTLNNIASQSSSSLVGSQSGASGDRTASGVSITSPYTASPTLTGLERVRSPSIRETEEGPSSYVGRNSIYSPPLMQRNYSAGSSSFHFENNTATTIGPIASPPLSTTSSNRHQNLVSRDSRRLSVMERTLIQVTEDNERFSVVDVSGLNSAAAIKERMLSKLHLFDEDPSCFALSQTEIGAVGSTGPRLDDDELLAMCWQMGDEKGTLKFLLHQIAPPAAANRAMVPPPQNLSPHLVTRDLGGGGEFATSATTNTATTTTTTPTTASRQQNSKTGSISSSRSSVNENGEGQAQQQQQQANNQSISHDSSSETSSSRPHSALIRSKATNRRSLATSSSSHTDDAGRPLSLAASADEAYDHSRSTPSTLHQLPNLNTFLQADSMYEQCSPIEEVSDALNVDDGRFGSQRRAVRPSTTQSRHTIHGQWESEMGGSASGGGPSNRSTGSTPSALERARPNNQRTSSHSSSIIDSNASLSSPSNASQNLPRSLLPGGGGREARAVDKTDASRMYISSHDQEYSDSNNANGSTLRPYASHSALNATTEDGRRRSKPSIHESSSGSQHRQQNDPTLRSQSVAPHSQRPSTGDATHGNNLPSFGPAHHQHTSPTPSHNYIMSPISPLTRPFDRERSSSFGAAPLPQSYRNMGPGTIHDQRAISIPRQGQAPIISMPRAPGQQQQHSGGHHPQGHNMHGQSPGHGYISSPPMRPMQPLGQFPPQGDRRFIGPSQTQGNIRPAQMYLPHEFGGRIQSLYDPRVGPYSTAPRPHSMQDWGNRYYQQQPPPQQQQQQSFRPPREDPYTSAHFPASSPRMVSEFQRSASTRVALQPGMTVQESLASAAAQHRNQQQQQQFRPQSPYMTHSPRPAASSVSMTQAASLPPSYAYDNRQSQHHHSQHSQQNPAMRTTGYDKRTEGSIVSQSSNNSNNNSSSRIPASMQYYYNPATPTSTPRPLIAPAASTSAPPPTQTSASSNDRSSGSSFVTNQSSSSHTRVTSSSEDRRQEGEHSAPTSARSSRSMGSKNEERKENVTSDSELPYAHDSVDSIKQLSNLTRQDSLNDEDLLKIRPLPTLPMIGKIDSADSKDEGTFKAGQWKEMMLKSLEDEDEGTARATNTKAEKEFANVTNVSSTNHLQDTETSPKGSSTTSLGTAIADPDMIRDGEGTFKTFDDDDDDDDIEGGTWAQPLDSAVQQTVKDSVISNVMNRVKSPRPEDGTLMPNAANADTLSGSNSPRKPILTLNIESPPSLTIKDINAISSSPDSSTIPGLQQPTPSPGSSNLGRQPSFARRERGDWAFRPPPEQLYENLDDFFPKADLDKPVIDPNAGLAGSNSANQGINPSSPQANSPRVESISTASNMPIAASFAMTPATNTVTQSEKQTTDSDSPHEPATSSAISPISRSRMQHKKSIRIVAQDRKKLLDRVEAAEQRKSGATDLNRRRSTKLWGGKVIEVTPGTENSSISSQLESPTSASSTTSDQQKPVFKWVKGDLIGKGTYGRVYLALNATTGEMIAVKQVELPRTASDREDARQKGVVAALKSEIETLKDLDHPNIVSYLGFEETKCNLSIFLEYVPGGSVGSCLRKHGKLDEATIKSFLQQILNGLNYLHGRGILHRDLKADNLLVDFNGIVKISDFGTVRKSEDIYGNVASMSMQGSIFWMAPEVLSRAGYSAKVDIWSLGCVVLEMFAGRRPWSDEEAVQAMFKIGAERRAPPIPPDVRLSKAAAHFLKICFAVDPNERPTANKLLIHVFPHAEPGWQFSMSSLYQQLHR